MKLSPDRLFRITYDTRKFLKTKKYLGEGECLVELLKAMIEFSDTLRKHYLKNENIQ